MCCSYEVKKYNGLYNQNYLNNIHFVTLYVNHWKTILSLINDQHLDKWINE